jgi:undecaprenyl diphosphate synthase
MKHIAFIMDGNRRYAKSLMKKPWEGHSKGAEKLKEVIGWTRNVGIRESTFYAFSIQNFNRPKIEFDFLMNIFNNLLNDLLNKEFEELEKNKVKIKIIGNISLFSEKLQILMNEVMDKTKDFNNYKLNICLGYGGQEEIIEAVKKVLKEKPEEINVETFSKYFELDSQPDIIIRTGGERRLSNFLTWQSVYSELFFLDVMWPDFSKEDFNKVIEAYKSRERRFGK